MGKRLEQKREKHSSFLKKDHAGVSSHVLIKVIWSMLSYQQALLNKSTTSQSRSAVKTFSPLLPKLLEDLHTFRRMDKPLQEEEFVMMH